ncbi:MAG: alpha/beta hydrolase [Anaeromyxobacter sp.]
MTPLAWMGLGALMVVVATAAHYAFWRWRLGMPAIEDELHLAATSDGWWLALGRCRPSGPPRGPPVLLVHGILMNRQAFEFGLERYALARYLSRAGFDCFSLDLRGHGDSRRAAGTSRLGTWNLDTYLQLDLPAALDEIRRVTGSEQVLYVGHSQGAILGLAAAGLYPARIAALVALAGPAHFDAQEQLRRLVGFHYPLRGKLTRFLARCIAPFAGYWHPQLAQLAVNLRNVEPRVYRRLLANAIENIPAGVLEQFGAFIREDSFRAMDGSRDYRAALEECRQPALFVAAERDGLAPPSVVQAAHRRWGGPKQYVIFEREWGHTDLLLGRRAPEVVYPVVRDWLAAHAGGAPRTAEPAGPTHVHAD